MIVFPVIFIKSLIQIIVEELGSSRLQRGDILLPWLIEGNQNQNISEPGKFVLAILMPGSCMISRDSIWTAISSFSSWARFDSTLFANRLHPHVKQPPTCTTSPHSERQREWRWVQATVKGHTFRSNCGVRHTRISVHVAIQSLKEASSYTLVAKQGGHSTPHHPHIICIFISKHVQQMDAWALLCVSELIWLQPTRDVSFLCGFLPKPRFVHVIMICICTNMHEPKQVWKCEFRKHW